MRKALFVLVGAGLVGGFIWLASKASGSSTTEFWKQTVILVLAGVALSLSQSFAGAKTVRSFWILPGLLPVLAIVTWILLFSQPAGSPARADIVRFSDTARLSGLLTTFAGYAPLFAFSIGVLLGFLLLPPTTEAAKVKLVVPESSLSEKKRRGLRRSKQEAIPDRLSAYATPENAPDVPPKFYAPLPEKDESPDKDPVARPDAGGEPWDEAFRAPEVVEVAPESWRSPMDEEPVADETDELVSPVEEAVEATPEPVAESWRSPMDEEPVPPAEEPVADELVSPVEEVVEATPEPVAEPWQPPVDEEPVPPAEEPVADELVSPVEEVVEVTPEPVVEPWQPPVADELVSPAEEPVADELVSPAEEAVEATPEPVAEPWQPPVDDELVSPAEEPVADEADELVSPVEEVVEVTPEPVVEPWQPPEEPLAEVPEDTLASEPSIQEEGPPSPGESRVILSWKAPFDQPPVRPEADSPPLASEAKGADTEEPRVWSWHESGDEAEKLAEKGAAWTWKKPATEGDTEQLRHQRSLPPVPEPPAHIPTEGRDTSPIALGPVTGPSTPLEPSKHPVEPVVEETLPEPPTEEPLPELPPEPVIEEPLPELPSEPVIEEPPAVTSPKRRGFFRRRK